MNKQNNNNEHLKQLKGFYLNKQYVKRLSKEIMLLIKEINLCKNDISDGKYKNYDVAGLERKLKMLMDELSFKEKLLEDNNSKLHIIEMVIDNIGQPYKQILSYRYIENRTIKEFAKDMSYSAKRMYQLHLIALQIYLININNISND